MNKCEDVGYCRSKSGFKVLLSDDKDISVIKDVFTVAVDDVDKVIKLDVILDNDVKIYKFRTDNGFSNLIEYKDKVTISSKSKYEIEAGNGYSIHIMAIRSGSFINSKLNMRINIVKKSIV